MQRFWSPWDRLVALLSHMLSRSSPTQCGRHPTQDSIGNTPLLLRIAPAMLYLPSWTSLLFWYRKVSFHHSIHTLWVYSMCAYILSHVQLFAAPQTIAHQAPLSLGLFRQEYLRVLPFSTPGDPLNPGTKSMSLASLVLAGFFTTVPPGKPLTLRDEVKSLSHNTKLKSWLKIQHSEN